MSEEKRDLNSSGRRRRKDFKLSFSINETDCTPMMTVVRRVVVTDEDDGGYVDGGSGGERRSWEGGRRTVVLLDVQRQTVREKRTIN